MLITFSYFLFIIDVSPTDAILFLFIRHCFAIDAMILPLLSLLLPILLILRFAMPSAVCLRYLFRLFRHAISLERLFCHDFHSYFRHYFAVRHYFRFHLFHFDISSPFHISRYLI